MEFWNSLMETTLVKVIMMMKITTTMSCELSEPYWRTGEIGWKDIELYENVLKAIESSFWRNKEKMKEMIEEANNARKKSLNKKFMDPILGVYPLYYCNVKSKF